MTYFTHLSQTNMPKNALQRLAGELLKDQSHRLIDNPDRFILDLAAKVEKLNADHPRCTPLTLRSYGFDPSSIGVTLGEVFTVSFHIYLVKEVADA